MNLTGLWRDLRTELDEGPGLLLVGLMTMGLVVVNTDHDPLLFVPSLTGFVAALARPSVLRRWWWWIGIAALIGLRTLMAWEGVDNHVVLTAYWAFALGLACTSNEPIEVAAAAGRWLVGLVFAFATYWKVSVPDFRSADFFSFTLLADDRFRHLATWVGGLPDAVHEANLRAIASIGTLDGAPATVQLASTGRIATVAALLTIGTILVEAAVAGIYLCPVPAPRRWWRAATLVAFCVFTYVIVPVGGFGGLLVAMTIADPSLSSGWRRGLWWLFVAIGAYGPVWHLIAA